MSKSIQFRDINNEKMYPHPYYPIGSLYLSINNTNPTTWFGGRWEQIAKGRTLIGVDINDTDFNTAQKVGGEKTHKLTYDEMPNHSHKMIGARAWNTSGTYKWPQDGATTGATEEGRTTWEGGGQPHNNLPPFFTCYIWCRIA